MFQEDDIIIHKIFGKGEVVIVDEPYFEVHFDQDEPMKVRKFTMESIEPFLVKE